MSKVEELRESLIAGNKTESYVGYLRPVAQWNKGKKAEFADRVPFIAPKIESGNEVGEGGDA
jgi:hypothetical protein